MMSMQKITLWILFTFHVLSLQAQTLNYKLTLLNDQNRPMANVEVTLIETVKRTVLKSKTNGAGVVNFKIEGGNVWQMNILQIQNYYKWQIVMPQYQGTQEATFTYAPEKILREMKAPVDRTNLQIVTEKQNLSKAPPATPQLSSIKIHFSKDNRQPLANFPIRLTNIRLLKAYEATTNAQGDVFFSLPNQEEFELDIEGINHFDYIQTLTKSSVMSLNKVFEPYPYQDVVKNDTIAQSIPENIKEGTSNRHLLIGYFRYENDEPVANQAVYLKNMDGKNVYKTQTNAEGIARFMLPKNNRYGVVHKQINQDFQIVKEVIDLSRAWGIGHSEKGIILPMPDKAPYQLPDNLQIQLIKTPQKLNEFFIGTGIEFVDFKNLSYKTHEYAALSYKISGTPALFEIPKGFLITTGSVFNALGINNSPSASWASSPYPVDDYVPSVFHHDSTQVYDACVLEFTIKPQKSQLTFDYLFASEEYSEYLDYDDGFGIFVEGEGFDKNQNIALLPDKKTPLSVANVNEKLQSSFFKENSKPESLLFKTFQYDGFTKKCTVNIPVKTQNTYKIKIVIFDRKDAIYDSGAFVNFYSH
jgi:hypothetical protein